MYRKILFILILTGIILFIFYRINPLGVKVIINGHTFYVNVAVTNSEKERGLGKQTHLDGDHGMIFPYDHKERYSFWMKDMLFPLDFIWLRDKEIMDLTENVPVYTGSKFTVVQPKTEIDTVLELPSGSIKKFNIKIGDKVQIKS